VERSCGPMDKNRIEGAAEQGERAINREALVIKARWRKSCSRAVKECVLTRGVLALCRNGDSVSWSEKSAEAVVAAGCGRRAERGGVFKAMSIQAAPRQMSAQAERVVGMRGEVAHDATSDEADCPRQATKDTGSALLEAALARANLQRAWKRVKANKGKPGVDGLDINQTARRLATHWPAIREQVLQGRYPSGAVVAYTRDSVGRIAAIQRKVNATSAFVTVVSNATYYPFGPLHALTFGNGRTLIKTYDADYAIDSVASSDPNGLVLDFTTDVMGNIVEARDSLGAGTPTREYAYDALYRLTRVEDGTGALMEDYAYTKTGDRTLKQLGNQAPQVYAYLAGTHHLAGIDGVGRSYDANGNTLSTGNGVQFGYDDRNRRTLTAIPRAQSQAASPGAIAAPIPADETVYRYNGRGERIETDFSLLLDTYSYAFGESGHHLGEYRGIGIQGEEIIYLDNLPVARISGKAISYLETDHLGTPRIAASSTSNAVQWHWDFFADAFGDTPPSSAAVNGISLGLRYPGQYAEAGGVNYNYFRDYEPGTGRYIESDPIGLSGGIHTFAYVYSNALRFMDRFGLDESNGMVCTANGFEPRVGGDYSGGRCPQVRDCLMAHEQCHADDANCSQPMQDQCSSSDDYGKSPALPDWDYKQRTEVNATSCQLVCLDEALRNPDSRCRDPLQRERDKIQKQHDRCKATDNPSVECNFQ